MTPWEIVDIAMRLNGRGIPTADNINAAIGLLVEAQRLLEAYERKFEKK